MRKIAPCLFVAAGSMLSDGASAADLSISAALGFESRYVFRGVQFAETSLQPSVTLTKGGLHVGAWFNLPVGDDDNVVPATGEELDLVLGYSGSLSALISYDIGVTYYTFPKAMSGFGDIYEEDGDGLGFNTVEPYLTLSFATPLSPTLSLYRDVLYDTFTAQGGASHTFALSTKASFDLSGQFGYVFDDAGGTDYLYGNVGANVSYAFSDASSVYAGVRYGGSDFPGGGIVDDSIASSTKASGFWWGVGLSTSF